MQCGYAGGFGIEPVGFAAAHPQLEDTYAEANIGRKDVWVSLVRYRHHRCRPRSLADNIYVQEPYNHVDYENMISSTGRMKDVFGETHIKSRTQLDYHNAFRMNVQYGFQQRTESDKSFGVVGLCDPSQHPGSSATLLMRGATMYHSKSTKTLGPVDPAHGFIPSDAYGAGLKALLQGQLTKYVKHSYANIVQ